MGRLILFIFCALACAVPGAPAAAKLTLKPSTDWALREYDDKCRLRRTFGEGEGAVTLWIDQGGAQQAYNVTLLGEPFANPYGPGIRIKPGNEAEIIRSYIKTKSSKGRPVLRMYGLTLVQPELERSNAAERTNASLSEARAGAIETLGISGAGLKPVQLELGPMGAQFGFLQGCGERLEGLLSEAGRALTQEASPPVPIKPDKWIGVGDWPLYLRAAQMSGKITVRLTVGKNGRASGCSVLSSNKPQLFDDPVCLTLIKRARFEPATNARKEPVASYYEYGVTFQIK